MKTRHYSPLDHLVMNFDQALRTLAGKPLVTERSNPAQACANEPELTAAEKDESMRLMRVNHCGEVAAQALYQGQALSARLGTVRERMERAAAEENDHLDWCEQRVRELGGRLSLLNPICYLGSFAIGAAAGAVGDKWSLGFVAETEKQVVEHLDDHLQRIAENDVKSRAILEQMKVDEAKHGATAKQAGGAELPQPVRRLMKLASKIMTGAAYRI
ncbi:MAG: 2-polyprenyl-3-methyl-6-methoxy-1,4-benzoquinone monooxygenase [Gammaproteobacteria bacterium]|nr:MAG: 2-polyprenyl-3-methyl-6-methoxy-1,4-benzoquinone monooxygenase [Gammaproteobacteria bacterium]